MQWTQINSERASKTLPFLSVELHLNELLATKTTEEKQSLTTDSKQASYEASYEASMTRKLRLRFRPYFYQAINNLYFLLLNISLIKFPVFMVKI